MLKKAMQLIAVIVVVNIITQNRPVRETERLSGLLACKHTGHNLNRSIERM